MKPVCLAALALSAALAATPSPSQPAEPAQAASPAPAPGPVKNFDVFVDPPTGFVFVKLPQGWKFVGKVEAQALASLPATVITSLLKDEPVATAQAMQATK